MTKGYGYKNDEICDKCQYEKTDSCRTCFKHMKFHRKQELIDKL